MPSLEEILGEAVRTNLTMKSVFDEAKKLKDKRIEDHVHELQAKEEAELNALKEENLKKKLFRWIAYNNDHTSMETGIVWADNIEEAKRTVDGYYGEKSHLFDKEIQEVPLWCRLALTAVYPQRPSSK